MWLLTQLTTLASVAELKTRRGVRWTQRRQARQQICRRSNSNSSGDDDDELLRMSTVIVDSGIEKGEDCGKLGWELEEWP